jgi:hypothetical protein
MTVEKIEQKITPIETEVGFIKGRDAIFLQTLNMVNEATFFITGELIGDLCSKVAKDIELPFSLTFKGVLLFKMIELDFDDFKYASCFDLIENSTKLAAMRERDKATGIGKMDSGVNAEGKYSDDVFHQHFIFRTYDTVFEVVSQHYDFVINFPKTN